MIEPRTLKGFRDFLPQQARKRKFVTDAFKKVFESYGFEPLETPALEYEDILLGKYGDEGDKLLYRFIDNGKRNVAMRYDQTVPLARVVAQYQNELPMPFKRYQIQPVWRAENTQKGRFREFVQCDIDTVGTASLFADAEIIAVAAKALEAVGLKNFKILVNDRKLFENISTQAVLVIDKLKKSW
jgi:histidyl-tRNA synthetase